MPLYCLLCFMHHSVGSLSRTLVTTELESLLGLKNRNSRWLCWTSTGRKNGVMRRTHSPGTTFHFTSEKMRSPRFSKSETYQVPGTRYYYVRASRGHSGPIFTANAITALTPPHYHHLAPPPPRPPPQPRYAMSVSYDRRLRQSTAVRGTWYAIIVRAVPRGTAHRGSSRQAREGK